jgi:nicotinate phosphoribosyltransferase
MKAFDFRTALYTDYYQFVMAQGFFLAGKSQTAAVFDYFFRENPFGSGYVIFAGLSDLLEVLESLKFEKEEIDYLESLGFNGDFLQHLKNFRFTGTIYSMREGELVFPFEPIVRVDGNLIECQLIETLLLNLLNFQSLIATKASRMRYAAGNCKLVDIGLRRAQGLGGIHGSKAAIIGGFDATSNTISARHYSLDVAGTHSHSWIQSFGDELTAFRKFAELYPDNCVLLVDTYNTMRSGLPNAIKVAKEMEVEGKRLKAIRLDSGDLALLSKKARAALDSAKLNYVQIIVSNQLDEHLISSILQQGAPVDAFGVGTRLLSAFNCSALQGVYKQCIAGEQPTLKFSDNYAKTTLPGRKKVMRYFDPTGQFDMDGIMMENEQGVDIFYHPFFSEQHRNVEEYTAKPLVYKVMDRGKIIGKLPLPMESARYATHRLICLPPEYRRFENPKQYKVGISPSLMRLRSFLFEQMQKGSMARDQR